MKAVVIDFDNTLVKSDVNVIIRDKSGNETSIPSAVFYTYKLQPGEEYDFREFDQPVKNPKVILENFQTLLTIQCFMPPLKDKVQVWSGSLLPEAQ